MIDKLLTFQFSDPYVLVIGLLPIFLILGSYLISNKSLNRYCDKSLLPWVIAQSKTKQQFKVLLPILSWIFFTIALAGPRVLIEQYYNKNQSKYDSSIHYLLDISKSMLVEDIYPNRITQAKLIINSLLRKTENSLVGLIVFSQNAHTVIPLTNDPNVIIQTLDSIEPNMLPIEGSNIKKAIDYTNSEIKNSTTKNNLIVLVSDGEFEITQTTLEEINITTKINTIGIGTSDGGPIKNNKGTWIKSNQVYVTSKLNNTTLKEIAKRSNGQHYIINQTIERKMIDKIIPKSIPNITNQESTPINHWESIHWYFLVPAIILFFISTIKHPNTKQKKSHESLQLKLARKNTPLLLLMILSLSLIATEEIKASDNISKANKYYHEENYIKAEKLYQQSMGFIGRFGQANSVYKQRNYSTALDLFTKAILQANTDIERATALFNLANTYYQLGNYQRSIDIYKDTLKYNPKLHQAKINLEYAELIHKRVQDELALRLGKTRKQNVKPGSGSRTAKIQEGVDIGNSKVTLSEEENTDDFQYAHKITESHIQKLIQRGIKHSNISSSKIDNINKSSAWEYQHTTIGMIERLVKKEKGNDFNLWKRLFEIEQGFPAPVKEPHVLKGKQAW